MAIISLIFAATLEPAVVFIETPKPLDPGSDLELTFTIPDSKETLRTKGRVIWSQPQLPDRKDVTLEWASSFRIFPRKTECFGRFS